MVLLLDHSPPQYAPAGRCWLGCLCGRETIKLAEIEWRNRFIVGGGLLYRWHASHFSFGEAERNIYNGTQMDENSLVDLTD